MSTLNKRNPIAKAVKLALLATATVSAFSVTSVFAAEEEATEEKKITITGSRIKRSDSAGSLPVTVIDREMLEMSGESSAADYLRNLTFNSTGSFRPQSGSSAQGTSGLDLRGIGANRTLVLVDGRRLPKSPSTGQDQDLNTIPMGAIERIEILTDGASAVYGSDAMGGVVNIITREDYEGAELMIGQASVSIPANGGDREEGSLLFGTSSAKSSLLGGVSWNHRDIVFARDFPWVVGGASVYGNSFTTLDADGNDRFNWVAIPDGAGGNACNFPGTGFFMLGARCAFDFTGVSADEASIGNKSLWLKAKHEINNDWELWANASQSKVNSFGRYAPVPDSSYFSTVLSATSPNNPTNPAGNVYDGTSTAQPVNWWHRFDALGNRDDTVDTELADLQVGVTGMIGDVELDFGLRRTENKTTTIGRNYLLRSAAELAIEDGSYDLRNPYGVDAAILNGMKVTISRVGVYDQDEVWASAAFDMFEMSGGIAQTVVGAEYREEVYSDQYDSLSEAGQVGGSAGNSAGGGRDVTAVYFETLLPVADTLEVSIAGRYDEYSDYGNDFSPKISAKWQPMDELSLRASFGEGFRAPSLDILTQLDSESADSVRDPESCRRQGQASNCSLQINGTRTANPDLGSEKSEQFAFGLAYQPTDWFNFSADYYNIKITDRIKFFGAQTLVNAELAGDPIPTGLGVIRTAPDANGDRAILSIIQGYGNEGIQEVSGLDFNGVFSYELFGVRAGTNVQLSHTIDTSVEGGRNLVKDPGVPENRLAIANSFALNDFTFGWNINFIDTTCDEIIAQECVGKVPSWTTHDLQVAYNAPWDGKITFGVQNAFEKEPPLGVGFLDGRDYDFRLYNGFGRITYLRYTQTF